MSTHQTQYLMLGVKIPYNNDTYERYEADHDNPWKPPKSGLATIYDGRDGRFIFIGKILERSEIDGVIDGPIELSERQHPALIEILSQLITKSYGIITPDIRLWFFTLYT